LEAFAMKKKVVAFVIALPVGALSLLSAAAEAQNSGSRIEIARNFVRADGCHDTTQHFSTTVPNVDQLDRSYHGVVDGIEFIETDANNGHAIRNVTWSGPNTISYELYAKGAGHWIDPPSVFGQKIGGGYCAGAAGASEGIIVYAHTITR
jgi:hypothetical protein